MKCVAFNRNTKIEILTQNLSKKNCKKKVEKEKKKERQNWHINFVSKLIFLCTPMQSTRPDNVKGDKHG